MAKEKKEKIKKDKSKKQDYGPKPKWRPWMTAVATVAGVTLISGATVLGVFLTGGFEEKVVSPENISFSYDESLFNANYSQLEVTDSDKDGEFKLVINTTTEEVTQRKVQLSFDPAQGNTITTAGGYISNTIIQVPQYVTLGQPFSVKLLTEILKDENGNVIREGWKDVNWIKGGVSTLYAQSENLDVSGISLKIAVDTPVYSTETIIYDSNGEEIKNINFEGLKVLAGESFYVDSKFIPAKSEYMYGDDSVVNAIEPDMRRMKHSFFEAKLSASQANAVSAEYDGKYDVHFTAANKVFEDPISIKAYTFKYADTEIAFTNENQNKPDLEFYIQATTSLSRNISSSVMQEQDIYISEATIGSFTITNRTPATVVRGKSTKIYLHYNKDNPQYNYFGASVLSNTATGRELDNMLKQIGIRFTLNGNDVTVGCNKLITLNGSQLVEYDIDGDGTAENFYLPYTGGANVRKGYWDITAALNDAANDNQSIKMEMVLFTNIEEGFEDVYKEGESEDAFVIDNKQLVLSNREAYEISWVDSSEETVSLEYSANGFAPKPINLSSYVNYPSDKDIVFFAHFKAEADAPGGINSVLGSTSYSAFIQDLEPNGSPIDLYLLNGHAITLYDTGSFDLYFASINPQLESTDESYIELWCNDKKTISCQKALYDQSVSEANIILPTAANKPGEPEAEEYYAYVGATNVAKNQFVVEFTVQEDSYPSFKDALEAGEQFSAVLYDSNNNPITHYFELYIDSTNPDYKNPILVDKEEEFYKTHASTEEYKGPKYVYRVVYKIKDSTTINTSLTIAKEGKTAQEYAKTLLVNRAELLYNKNAADETTDIAWGGENKGEFKFDKKLYVYNPQTAAISSNSQVDMSKTIVVSQKLKTIEGVTDFDIDIEGFASVEDLVSQLTGIITITDQHDNTESLAGKWKFATDDPAAIRVSEDMKSFVFGTSEGTDKGAKIRIYSQDGVYANREYMFSLTTTGITRIEAADGTVSGTTSASVIKAGYPATGTIDIRDLVNFYYVEEGAEKLYNPANVTYTLSAITTSSMTDQQKIDLFGIDEKGGWITLKDADGEVIYAVVSGDKVVGLNGTLSQVDTITVNKHFATDSTLVFNISATGINTTLSVTLAKTAEINGDAEYSVYAGYNYTAGTTVKDSKDKIANNLVKKTSESDTSTTSILEAYDFGAGDNIVYFIVQDDVLGAYVLTTVDPEVSGAITIGTLTATGLHFNDFWTKEKEQFTVHFAPEGENYYAAKKDVVFTVYRNIKISANAANIATNEVKVTYSDSLEEYLILYGNNSEGKEWSKAVSSYITVSRMEGEVAIPSTITISTNDDSYLKVNGTNFERTTVDMVFNTKESLSTLAYVKFGSDTLAAVEVKIKLLASLHANIASLITHENADGDQDGVATVQTINGVNYIVIDASTAGANGWIWNTTGIASGPDSIVISNSNYQQERTSLYLTLPKDEKHLTVNFKTNGALYGYNSNQYMIVRCADGLSYEWIYIPTIVTSVGAKPVEYNNNGNEIISQAGRKEKITDYSSRYLDIALMNPDELIAQGIYDEYIAGETYNLLFSENGNKGMRFVDGAIATIEKYNLATSTSVINKLVQTLDWDTTAGKENITLGLYDLADNIDGDFYVALKYTISLKSGYSQSFYYVMKIIPNVHAEKPVYPYGSDDKPAYFETLQDAKGTIELDKIFDTTTLHNEETRFNVSYLLSYDADSDIVLKKAKANSYIRISYTDKNGTLCKNVYEIPVDIPGKYANEIKLGWNDILTTEQLDNIVEGTEIRMILQGKEISLTYGDSIYGPTIYKDEISNVTVNDSDVYTDAEDWENFIKFEIEDGVITYEAVKSDSIKFTVKRSYVSATDAKVEQIVNGSHEYVFAVNNKEKNYSIKFVQQNDDIETTDKVEEESTTLPDEFGTTEYVVSFRNGDVFTVDETKNPAVASGVYGLTANKDKDKIISYTYTGLDVILVENAVAGSANSGTEVFGELRVELSAVEGDTDHGKTISATYDEKTGEFSITLPEYLDQDTKAIFAVFTSYGYEATLIFDIKANATVSYVDAGYTFKAVEVDVKEIKSENETTTTTTTKTFTAEGPQLEDGKDVDMSTLAWKVTTVVVTTTEKTGEEPASTTQETKGEANITDISDGTLIQILRNESSDSVGRYTTFVYNRKEYKDGQKFAYIQGLNTLSQGTKYVKAGFNASFAQLFNIEIEDKEIDEFVLDGDVASETVKNYFKTANNNIKISDSAALANKTFLGVPFKVTFTDGNVFRFAADFVVEPNVKTTTSGYTYPDHVIAMTGDFEISFDKFIQGYTEGELKVTNTVNENIHEFSYDVSTGVIKIKPEYVAKLTDVTIYLTFTLNSKEEIDVRFDFTIAPAVEFVPNYPNPTGNGQLNVEYVEGIKTTDYSSVSIKAADLYGWLNAKATLAKNGTSRMEVYANTVAQTSGKDLVARGSKQSLPEIGTDAGQMKVTLSGLENAYVYEDQWWKEIDNADGTKSKIADSDRLLALNTVLGTQDLIFMRGPNTTKASVVKLMVEYHGVQMEYVINISDSLWTSQINPVTNNIDTSSGNTTEKIYVDKTNIKNLFADDRMAQISISSSATVGEYYLVFGKKTTEKDTGVSTWSDFKLSYAVYIKTFDLGKTLYIDLGIGMSGLEFYGAYNVNEFEVAGLAFNESRGIIVSKSGVAAAATESDINNDDIAPASVVGSVSLANRIQLYYGETLSRYAVASGLYEIAEFNIPAGKPIDQVASESVTVKAENKDVVTQTYYYQPTIDIEMTAVADGVGYVTTLIVNEEYPSFSKLFGLKHPTTGQNLSPADGGMITLSFDILNDDDAKLKDGFKRYYDKYADDCGDGETIGLATYTKNGTPYIYYAQVLNASGQTYDYNVVPQGAKNNGDYVLTEIVYGVDVDNDGDVDYSKTFYTVVKILPDYVVKYGGADNSVVEDGMVTNSNNPASISQTDDTLDGYYIPFALAGKETNVSVDANHNYKVIPTLSIKHAGDSAELSLSNFTYTMPVFQREFNIELNINKKLFGVSGTEQKEDGVWTLSDGLYTFNGKDAIVFELVPHVQFGEQTFYIEGVDEFGFKCRVYFRLESKGDIPSKASDPVLYELGNFDVGLRYTYLLPEWNSEADEYVVSANANREPQADSEFSLITLQGIDAWMFANNVKVKTEGDQQTISVAGGEYQAVAEASKGYLKLPTMYYVSIDSIEIQDTDGNFICDAIAPTKEDISPFMTNGDDGVGLELVGKDDSGNPKTTKLNNRGKERIEDSGESGWWKMPRLSGTLFGKNTFIDANIVITLNYDKELDGTVDEKCSVAVPTTIYREIVVQTDGDNTVVDGQSFAVADQFKVTSGSLKKADENPDGIIPEDNLVYYNDTLEVLANAGSDARFSMTLTRQDNPATTDINEAINNTVSVRLTNSTESVKVTKYMSLSEYFDVTLMKGDIITFSNVTGVSDMYYISDYADSNDTGLKISPTEEGMLPTWKDVTINTITNDYVYVENEALLSSGSYNVTKYYIIKATLLTGREDPKEQEFSYRISKSYKVTGYYYDFTSSVSVIPCINQSSTATTAQNITFANWATGAFAVESKISGATAPENLKFQIKTITINGNESSIGIGSFTGSTLVLNRPLAKNEFIKVAIYMYVSGTNRSFDVGTGEEHYLLELGVVSIGAKLKASGS